MKPFFPAILTTMIGQSIPTGDPVVEAAPIPSHTKQFAGTLYQSQRRHCAELGLIASLATIDRILDLISKPDSTWGQWHELGRELHGRLNDELFGTLFFSLDSSEVAYYGNPTRDWEQVIKTWPKTQIDIEESSKCYALGRYAAAIFHALLVAEMGVIELSKLLGVAGDKPGWGALDRLEKILTKSYRERSPIEQTHSELLKQILPLMLAMKDSWRHKISHVENRLEWLDTDFSPQLAEEIIKSVRGFMRRLATTLPPSAS
jgi:hypothetical protein